MVRVGIIGHGWGERSQAPNFREAGMDVVAIAGHRDWRQVLDSAAELVTIVTPPSTHVEIATAALQAGKHIICEKPTALNASEAEQLVAVARAHPKQIAIIDHELRFLPSFVEARKRIRDMNSTSARRRPTIVFPQVLIASPESCPQGAGQRLPEARRPRMMSRLWWLVAPVRSRKASAKSAYCAALYPLHKSQVASHQLIQFTNLCPWPRHPPSRIIGFGRSSAMAAWARSGVRPI